MTTTTTHHHMGISISNCNSSLATTMNNSAMHKLLQHTWSHITHQ